MHKHTQQLIIFDTVVEKKKNIKLVFMSNRNERKRNMYIYKKVKMLYIYIQGNL